MFLTTVVENKALDVRGLAARVREVLSDEGYVQALSTISGWDGYSPTPIVARPDLAAEMSISELDIKDESSRLGLGSFKALGGAYAVHMAHERWLASAAGHSGDPFVVSCVTDGNHGLSVAWGAKQLGCECVIYVPSVVRESRAEAIRALGASVVRVEGNYDEVTRVHEHAAKDAGWVVVTDTTSSPVVDLGVVDVMQGYRVMAQEMVAHYGHRWPTHVFLQAGCGGMAASVIGHLATVLSEEDLPVFVIVEPAEAACLQASAAAGRPETVLGRLHTMMAGLSVGEVSIPAWKIIEHAVKYFVAISDDNIPAATRSLGRSHDQSGDPVLPVASGETGVAGFSALQLVAADDTLRSELGLSANSRVLVISTEGATDPELYQSLMAGGEA